MELYFKLRFMWFRTSTAMGSWQLVLVSLGLLGQQLLPLGFPRAITYMTFEREFLPREDRDDDTIDLSDLGATLYGAPDPTTTGKLVANTTDSGNPEELGTYLEGDLLFLSNQSTPNKNGMLATSKRWRGAIVPYVIQESDFNQSELASIRHALKHFHTSTCVRFRKRANDRDFVAIESSESGCWSAVGRAGGRQVVNLQTPSCLRQQGTIIHELMHALGFLHEHNRHERDGFVRVLRENVWPQMLSNFKKYPSKDTHGFGVKYDYASVMHYSAKSFSKNGQPTLEALQNNENSKKMGQRVGFSEGDVRKINAMYKCKM